MYFWALLCLQSGHSKPRECQGFTAWSKSNCCRHPPSPSGQRPAVPIDPPKDSLSVRPHPCVKKKKEKILPIVLCVPINPVGVREGTPFEITDNYKGPVLTGSCQYKFPLLISNLGMTGELYKTSVKQESWTIVTKKREKEKKRGRFTDSLPSFSPAGSMFPSVNGGKNEKGAKWGIKMKHFNR